MKRRKRGESHKRSLAKSITWRITASLTTMLLVFLFTGKLEIAFSVGIAEVILKMILYYLHERVWLNIGWS